VARVNDHSRSGRNHLAGRIRRIPPLALVMLALPTSPTLLWAQGASPNVAPLTNSPLPTLAPLVKRVTPAVVNIATKGRIAVQRNPLLNDPFFRRFFDIPNIPAEREIASAGSGVIVDARQGLIVTNHHVVEHADEVSVTLIDGRRLPARRVGADPVTDIAIIKIAAENLTAIPLGDSDRLEVGDYVVAVGNPFGLGQTVTQGIVSAVRRSGPGLGQGDFIQTDAAINPGNSGGALVTLRGELIGINAAIIGTTGANVGIGFAVPVNAVRGVMDQLVRYGDVQRGQLGVTTQDLTPDLAQALGLPADQRGAVIVRIEAGSVAERSGFRVRDAIVAVNRSPVRDGADLRDKFSVPRVGDVVDVEAIRDGRSISIRATVTAAVNRTIAGDQLSPLLAGGSFAPSDPTARVKGVRIVSVGPDSRLALAGMNAGDIITSVNRGAIEGIDDFAARVKASPRSLLLTLTRGGASLVVMLQ
jgi:Do/DeqQ family serine protease